MRQVEWEKKFLDSLERLPEAERYRIAEYYREMYGDKLESGQTPDEILAEFGDPKECAERILKENENGAENLVEEPKTQPEQGIDPEKTQQGREEPVNKGGYWTPATIVGMVFLTLFLVIPLCGGALGIIAGLGSIALTGGVLVLAGCLYVILAPFMCFTGASVWAIIANMGMGFALSGAGILLGIAFYFATKYAVIWCWKALLWVYKRGK